MTEQTSYGKGIKVNNPLKFNEFEGIVFAMSFIFLRYGRDSNPRPPA